MATYRQLQNILKQAREINENDVTCKLTAPWGVLVAEVQKLQTIGYSWTQVEEFGDYTVKYDAFYNFEPGIFEAYKAKHCTPKAKKAPFNAHVEMWSMLARASEILIGIVTLDYPDDYKGEIQDLASKLGSFIYFNIGYRHSDFTQSFALDDLETAKQIQERGEYKLAKMYLDRWKGSFYVNGLDDRFSPYFKTCKELITSLT